MLLLWLSDTQKMLIVPVSSPFCSHRVKFITLAPYIQGKVQQPLLQNHHNVI
jgi:hypothetical protein